MIAVNNYLCSRDLSLHGRRHLAAQNEVFPSEQGTVFARVILCGSRPCEAQNVERGYIPMAKACYMFEVCDCTRLLCKSVVLLNAEIFAHTLVMCK